MSLHTLCAMSAEEKQGFAARLPHGLIFAVGLLVFILALFHEVLDPARFLLTTDDNIGALALRKSFLPDAFFGGWDDSLAVGQAVPHAINWTHVCLWLFPALAINNWLRAIDLALASLFLFFFLRGRGLRAVPCALAALTACWLGSTFFLIYAGHINKFAAVMFAALCLWLIDLAVRRNSWSVAVLAGGAMGGIFLEQLDTGLFFAMPLGAYALYAAWRAHGKNYKAIAILVLPVALVAGSLAIRPALSAVSSLALDAKEQGVRDEQENWDYCTQWSWPPEETIEWIAPGYTGWRSGEPAGPYWGRMGQSAEWARTGQGFMNFKLETLYIGIIPVAFMMLAFAAAFGGWFPSSAARGEAFFWMGVTVVTFLLGLGKFFPLYHLFYQLPFISSIRNPVKFMQVTQMAIGIAAAYGLDLFITQAASAAGRAQLRRFGVGLWVAAGVFAAWWLLMVSGEATFSSHLASAGWGEAAATIARNKSASVLHCAVLLLVTASLCWTALRSAKPAFIAPAGVAALLLALAAADQGLISRHYVRTATAEGYIDDSEVTRYLKQNPDQHRFLMFTQSGFYNFWLTYLLPYHGIQTFNIAQMRMPEEYKRYFAAVGNQPANMWRQCAIGIAAGPGAVWSQLQASGTLSNLFQPVIGFNVAQSASGGAQVVPPSPGQAAQHLLFKMVRPAPRYALVAGWEGVSDDEALRRLGDPQRDYLDAALLTVDDAKALPAPTGRGVTGAVSVVEYKAGRVKLRAQGDHPAVLRLADKFDPKWRVTVDGKPARLMRCDYLFQGVFLEPGAHDVELKFRTPIQPLYVQFAATFLCAIALLHALATIRRDQRPA